MLRAKPTVRRPCILTIRNCRSSLQKTNVVKRRVVPFLLTVSVFSHAHNPGLVFFREKGLGKVGLLLPTFPG